MTARPRIGWPEAALDLDPVSLAEVDAAAALQTRTDRKYLVDPGTWALALAGLAAAGPACAPRVLEIDGRRTFRYESTYFDTPRLDSFRDAARRRPRRYKVRTRHYVETGTRAIEVKLRSRTGQTVKHREWLAPASVQGTPGPHLTAAARAFVAGFAETADAVGALRESLTTRYSRTTLLLADSRVTIDTDVTGTAATGAAVTFGDTLIVETKSASRAGDMDRALWALGVRPARVSKYCTCLAALQPELPANRWARTLRRHLSTETIADQPALAGA